MPATTVKFAKVSGVQTNGYVRPWFIFWLCEFKTGLECRNNQSTVGDLLSGPVFDHMFDPETAELWWVRDGGLAKPLVAQINLLLRNGCIFVFSQTMIKDSTCDNLQ